MPPRSSAILVSHESRIRGLVCTHISHCPWTTQATNNSRSLLLSRTRGSNNDASHFGRSSTSTPVADRRPVLGCCMIYIGGFGEVDHVLLHLHLPRISYQHVRLRCLSRFVRSPSLCWRQIPHRCFQTMPDNSRLPEKSRGKNTDGCKPQDDENPGATGVLSVWDSTWTCLSGSCKG